MAATKMTEQMETQSSPLHSLFRRELLCISATKVKSIPDSIEETKNLFGGTAHGTSNLEE